MNLKKILISSLLLAIGFILHEIAPPMLFGMKPDFLLAMMFIAILVTDDYKAVLTISLTAGVITAMTTTFPGGQIPNIVDKLITGQIIYALHKTISNKINIQFKVAVIAVLGTLFSGCIFLSTALLMVGLPAPFLTLMLTVVVPATIVNCICTLILYKAVNIALKRRRA